MQRDVQVYIEQMSTLTVRKLNVDLSRGFPRHWMGGDVYRTAFMNALSMSFPLGEQMFIDSVRAARPKPSSTRCCAPR